MKRVIFAAVIALMSTAAPAAVPYQQGGAPNQAQRQPSPEEMKQMMDMTFGSMVPMMVKMTEMMIDASLRIGEKKETADSIAKFKKNLYEALIKQGFSKEESFQIMMNSSVPSAMPPMK